MTRQFWRSTGRLRFAVSQLLVAGVAVAIALAGGGISYALLSTQAVVPGANVVAGDLRLSTGVPAWRQVTPGVSNPASGTLTSTPSDFYSVPGDVIEIRTPATTYLRGENLAGALSVRYANPADVSPDVTSTFYIEDTAGNQVAPASGQALFGQFVVVPGLVGDNAGRSADWTLVVRVVVGGDFQWFSSSISSAETWTVGTFAFDLVQTRTLGEGEAE